MRTRLAVVVFLFSLGCQGDSGPCEPPDGAYEFRYRERAGDCGDQTSVVRFENGAGLGGDNDTCEVDTRESADGCSIDFEQRCDIYDDQTGDLLGELQSTGALELARDGSSISGTWEIEATDADGDRICRGVGDVSYQRL